MEYWQITPIVLLVSITQVVPLKDVLTPSINQRDLHIRVTTILVEPYVMMRQQPYNSTTGHYEGYIVDLLDKIKHILGVHYRIHPVADGSYGYKKSDGTWDGMIGEIVKKEADLAAGPLYITKPRKAVVDFSIPFLRVQATLVQLRKSKTHKPVSSIAGLLDQSEIRYGTIKSGMLVRAFRTSNHSLYRNIWAEMRGFKPTVYMETNELGIDRVRNSGGKYAYILPDSIGDYIVRKSPCDLVATDKFLMSRYFGLAVNKGSGLLYQLNKAMRILKETGELERLYDKWWKERTECNGILSSKIIGMENVGNCIKMCLLTLFVSTYIVFVQRSVFT